MILSTVLEDTIKILEEPELYENGHSIAHLAKFKACPAGRAKIERDLCMPEDLYSPEEIKEYKDKLSKILDKAYPNSVKKKELSKREKARMPRGTKNSRAFAKEQKKEQERIAREMALIAKDYEWLDGGKRKDY